MRNSERQKIINEKAGQDENLLYGLFGSSRSAKERSEGKTGKIMANHKKQAFGRSSVHGSRIDHMEHLLHAVQALLNIDIFTKAGAQNKIKF